MSSDCSATCVVSPKTTAKGRSLECLDESSVAMLSVHQSEPGVVGQRSPWKLSVEPLTDLHLVGDEQDLIPQSIPGPIGSIPDDLRGGRPMDRVTIDLRLVVLGLGVKVQTEVDQRLPPVLSECGRHREDRGVVFGQESLEARHHGGVEGVNLINDNNSIGQHREQAHRTIRVLGVGQKLVNGRRDDTFRPESQRVEPGLCLVGLPLLGGVEHTLQFVGRSRAGVPPGTAGHSHRNRGTPRLPSLGSGTGTAPTASGSGPTARRSNS